MMEIIDLFSTKIYKTKIDKGLYNYDELLSTIEENYKIQPSRLDVKDFTANTHNYYEGWNNEKFKKLNLEYLSKIYFNTTKEFFTYYNIADNVDWSIAIVNLSASKKHQGIAIHDHLPAFYSTVHYLRLSCTQQKIRFFNPLSIGKYAGSIYDLSKIKNHIDNSNLYQSWTFDVEEDDMIFFPSYLEHDVVNGETDELRISISNNIYLDD